jgi:ankyrin repeat protein
MEYNSDNSNSVYSETSDIGEEFANMHLEETGDVETIMNSISNGARTDVRNRLEETALHIAAQNGHIEAIDALLASGADIEAEDYEARTPLHVAAEWGQTEAIYTLLNRDANIEAEKYLGLTPLHVAALNVNINAIDALLERGANIESTDIQGGTPLYTAISSQNADCIASFISEGAKFNIPLENIFAEYTTIEYAHFLAGEETVLPFIEALASFASDRGAWDLTFIVENKELAEALVRAVDCTRGIEGFLDSEPTLLHIAARSGESGLVNVLIERGADIHAVRGEEAYTPLYDAAIGYHAEVLIALNSTIPENERLGIFRHMQTLFSGKKQAGIFQREEYHLLNKFFGTVGISDEEKSRLLRLAIEYTDEGLAIELLNQGVHPELPLGVAALHLAAVHGCNEIINTLVAQGVDVDTKTDDSLTPGLTPLRCALERKQTDTVRLLVSLGANIYMKKTLAVTHLLTG